MTEFEDYWPKTPAMKPKGKASSAPVDDKFEALVTRYHKLVTSLIWRYYGGRLKGQADDLSQEIWAKLWVAFKKNENNVVNFKSYLYRTVQTTLWDAIRSQDPALEEPDDQPEVTSQFGEGAVHARLSLDRLSAGLKPQEAQMLRAYLKGFSNSEIATLLGCSEGRVRNLLTRIKKKMARMGDA